MWTEAAPIENKTTHYSEIVSIEKSFLRRFEMCRISLQKSKEEILETVAWFKRNEISICSQLCMYTSLGFDVPRRVITNAI